MRAKTLAELERLKEIGFDPEAEALTLELAREFTNGVEPAKFLDKQREFETQLQQFQERLKALEFWFTQFEELLSKYRNNKPAEVTKLLTAKIKECEALCARPGVQAADVGARLQWLQDTLATLQPASEHPKYGHTTKSS